MCNNNNIVICLPVTFNMTLPVAVTSDCVLIDTSHSYSLFSSAVLNSGIVYVSMSDSELSLTKLSLTPLIVCNSEPSLLHIISTLLVIPLTVVTQHSSINERPTV